MSNPTPAPLHRERIAHLLSGETPVTWVFTGDSITHGALHTFGHRHYPEHFAERVRWELRRTLDLVINTGVNGWTIDALSGNLNRAVFQHQPDVVSINLGINDAAAGAENLPAFTRLYRQTLEQITERTNAALILQTPNAIDAGPRWNRDSLPLYVDAIRELATEFNTVLVDHAKVWEDARTREILAYWLSDALHPNEYGHRQMAHTLLQELGIHDPASAVGRLLVP